jgi:hypothetical protein
MDYIQVTSNGQGGITFNQAWDTVTNLLTQTTELSNQNQGHEQQSSDSIHCPYRLTLCSEQWLCADIQFGQLGVDHIRTLTMETASEMLAYKHTMFLFVLHVFKTLCSSISHQFIWCNVLLPNPCMTTRPHHTGCCILHDMCKTHLPAHLACLPTCTQTCFLVG